MKRLLLLLCFQFSLFNYQIANADGFLIGAKLGLVDVDLGAFDTLPAGGLLAGYEFDNLFPAVPVSLGVEGEFLTSLVDGDVNYGGFNAEWDINTQAIYATAKMSGGIVYGKAKLGYLREEITISTNFFGTVVDGSDTGISAGFALGFSPPGPFAIEAGYTLIEDDVSFYSIGANFHF